MDIEKNLLILLNLTGLSPVKAKAIAENFVTIDTLLKTEEDALVSVSGIDRIIARRILDFDRAKLEE